jgi:hypothetical protein
VAHWDYLAAPVRAWFTAGSLWWAPSRRELRRWHVRSPRRCGRGGVWARTRWVPEYGRDLTVRKLAALRRGRPDATVFDIAWTGHVGGIAQNAAEDAAAGRLADPGV